jgi:hypothetical protein
MTARQPARDQLGHHRLLHELSWSMTACVASIASSIDELWLDGYRS